MPRCHRWRHTIVAVALVTPLVLLPLEFVRSAVPPKAQLPAPSVKAIPKPQLPARSIKTTPKAELPTRSVKAIPKAPLPTRSVKAIPKAQLPTRSIEAIPKTQLATRSVEAIPKAQLTTRTAETNGILTLQPEPLRLPNTAIEPIEWNALSGWETDDHAAAF